MKSVEARQHHFVPKFLLRPWSIDDAEKIRAYRRVPHRRVVESKIRSLDSVCSQLDLLTLRRHPRGRDAIEKIFFGNVDHCGAKARDRLPKHGPVSLDSDSRSDWARVLLSLEARRPAIVKRLKYEGAAFLREQLDGDQEIQGTVSNEGYDQPASLVAAAEMGVNFEDRALMVIQGLVDDPRVGRHLINARWHVRRLPYHCHSRFIISDRPLIRLHAYDSPGAVWLIPISPRSIFLAAAHENNLIRLLDLDHKNFCERCNISSARQADMFVFSVSQHETGWLEEHLPR